MRLPLHRGVALFAMMVLSLPAGATTLTCRGELAFADALARAVTVSVELESGLVRIPACTKYPELAGFCQAHILTAKAHRFVFDDVVSLQERREMIECIVDDSGERMTGRCAAAGSRGASTESRSCTTCRAAIRSDPSLRISTTDDSWLVVTCAWGVVTVCCGWRLRVLPLAPTMTLRYRFNSVLVTLLASVTLTVVPSSMAGG